MNKNSVGIGLLGFGTVGAGVVEGLRRNSARIEERLGLRLETRRIADLDIETDRGVAVERDMLTTDAMAVVEDPSVEVVVELIGGSGAALDLVMAAIDRNKPVVTANKKLLAEHGREIFDRAAERGVDVYFGASVGGGIPIVRALREGLVGNAIEGMLGILNGTCNFILTRMERDDMPFETALSEARREGYAEADPTLDIDGWDTAHKAAILVALAYGVHVPIDKIPVEGIRGISRLDVRYASEMGFRIKMLAVISRLNDKLELRVQPTLVSREHVLASVNDVFNAVMVRGDLSDETLYYGRGAGRRPTASTVIGDIADAARDRMTGRPRRPRPAPLSKTPPALLSRNAACCSYYLRLSVLDRAGSFARIAGVLGAHEVSIASVMQKASRQDGRFVPVVVLTHETRTDRIEAALAQIVAGDVVDEAPVRFPIQE